MEPPVPRHPLAAGPPESRPAATPGPSIRARDQARAGLYVHVPFCAARCSYCDFSSGSLSAAAVERYLAALELEVRMRAPQAGPLVFSSVFFGGGTPSALSARHFRRLWRILVTHVTIDPGAEITLEANPESVRGPLLDAWAEAGVNRLSMGAQSFWPDELELLGRIHPPERPARAAELARSHGFERLSLDLMFGFPGHHAGRWAATLDRALEIAPGHLSAYCFIPEPGTPLGDAALTRAAVLPAPEEQADLYQQLTARLEEAGYGCYETSNFCRPGGEARHNLVYWLRRPYLGLGPSAHGLLAGARRANHYALARWAESLEAGLAPESEVEPESESSAASECMMLALRLATGLRPADYPAALRRAIERRYRGAFDRGLATGRLTERDGSLAVPAGHRFVADDVIAWIEAQAERVGFDTRSSASVPSLPCPSLRSPAA